MSIAVLFLLVVLAIIAWWFVASRLTDKPWERSVVADAANARGVAVTPPSKIGLGIFLAVVTSFFALFMQADWVVELAGLLPSVALTRTATVEAVAPRVWRISTELTNNGYLPTNAAIGVRSRLPRRVMVELKLGSGQSLTSGRKVQYIDALRGSGSVQRFEWLVVGDAGSTVTLTVGAPNTGGATETITLRAR